MIMAEMWKSYLSHNLKMINNTECKILNSNSSFFVIRSAAAHFWIRLIWFSIFNVQMNEKNSVTKRSDILIVWMTNTDVKMLCVGCQIMSTKSGVAVLTFQTCYHKLKTMVVMNRYIKRFWDCNLHLQIFSSFCDYK